MMQAETIRPNAERRDRNRTIRPYGRPYGRTPRSTLGTAFTLIELLVVVAIISLLVSILLPSLNRAKDLARKVQCLSNLRSIAIGSRFYLDDHDERFLWRDWDQDDVEGEFPQDYLGLTNEPADSMFTCPANNTFAPTDYLAYNITIAMNTYATDDPGVSHPKWEHLGAVPQPSEGCWWMSSYSPAYEESASSWYWPRVTKVISKGTTLLLRGGLEFPYAHPGDSVNVAYIDGHCGSVDDVFLHETNASFPFWYGN